MAQKRRLVNPSGEMVAACVMIVAHAFTASVEIPLWWWVSIPVEKTLRVADNIFGTSLNSSGWLIRAGPTEM